MTIIEDALTAMERWYESLPIVAQNNGPAKGTIAGSLLVLERLKEEYSLDIKDHLTAGGAQIRGAGGKAVARILAQHGETRHYVSEGGRTNRGLPRDIGLLLETLEGLQLEGMDLEGRRSVLDALQEFLVEKVCLFHAKERLKFEFDAAKSVWQLVNEILLKALKNRKEGPVAQYLVGAKLALRFPDLEVDNQSYSTADVQTERPGDFAIEDTAFHVTVAPQTALFEKCKGNLRDGLRAYVIVPDRALAGARLLAEQASPGKISVVGVEGFVAQNIEEMACFSNTELVTGLRALLETYNARTDEVEMDKSMLIKIPANLRK